ncbi:MAG: AMP-binding protein [Bacilli bacterium]|nr:AMP-binding protein [Bacilli bacterium]
MDFLDMRFLSFIGIKKIPDAPWQKYYKKSDMNISVKNINIYEFLKREMEKYKYHDKTAINYYGTRITYREFLNYIDKCSSKFLMLGVKKYDIITIVCANIPEALISFYALNKIGAIVNLIHPLLSENEIKDALNLYKSKYLITMDITIGKINNIIDKTKVKKVIVVSPSLSMGKFKSFIYKIKSYNSRYHGNLSNKYISWKYFMNLNRKYVNDANIARRDDPALILQSGGTTGTPKGIVLSNGNVNSATISALHAYPDLNRDDVILGIMPIFHGFGLEVSINDAFCVGAEVVLIPTFKAGKFDSLLRKYNPSVLVGVPTLFEVLTTNKNMQNVNLSNLKYVISGGDTLSRERVENINNFLYEHGSRTNMIQGYGLTEAVAAVAVDLKGASRPGTIGIPWPGIYIKIFEPGSETPVKYGVDGEICICGPVVMLGYFKNEAETNQVLKHHKDGNIWLHTGDIGSMDKDGFITYKQRIKRMIVSSGYNVYPSQIEEVISMHEAVLAVTVVGIPHPYKVEVPKAFIVLKKGYHKNQDLIDSIKSLCKKNLAHYSIPKEFEFRNSLPKTIVGKIDFTALQKESEKKNES